MNTAEEFIKRIGEMSKEDLAFTQKMLKFFAFLGIDEKMLSELPEVLSTYSSRNEMINKNFSAIKTEAKDFENRISTIEKIASFSDTKPKTSLEDLNSPTLGMGYRR